MKGMILSGLVAVSVLAFAAASAGAADGSEFMAQCKENIDNDLPPDGDPELALSFCQCLVDKAGDNQDLIDEHLSVAQAPPEQRAEMAKNASDEAKADGQACLDELGITSTQE